MAHRDVVVVGASAGGVEALRAMVGGLPADLAASVLVVLHMPRDSPSALSRILARSGPLPARTAFDGEPLAPGRIYVSPPDRHLLVLDHRVRLSHGPSENGHRPAVDPLFRSAARAAGSRVIAVVLSGSRDDGAVGAARVAEGGGVVVVQRPGDALNGSMPQAVIDRVKPVQVADAAELGELIGRLTRVGVPEATPAGPLVDAEVAIDAFRPVTTDEIVDQRVGHAWSPESLIDEQAVATEGALWTALRALEEKSALSRRMAGHEHPDRGRFTGMAEDAENAGRLIRDLLTRLAASTAAHAE